MKKINWKWEWPHWIVLALLTIHYLLKGRLNVNDQCREEAAALLSNIPDSSSVFTINFDIFLMLVFSAFLVYVLLLFLPMIDPYRKFYTTSIKVFHSLRFSILILIAGLYTIFQYGIIQPEFSVTMAILIFLGIVLMGAGNQMGKIRPNWFIGIPTPWTLTSKRSWQKTNRLGGWFITLQGLILIPVSIFSTGIGVIFFIFSTAGIFISLMIYSYYIHRADEEKEPTFTAS